MRNRLIGFVFILFAAFHHAQGQADSLIYTLPRADLKWGIPNGILISPDNKYFLVSYDYNPSFFNLYELNGFKKLKRFKIRGHIYLSYSFFYSDNKQVYIDIGKRINVGKEKIQYFLIDLNSGKRKRIKCEDGPKGCDYSISSPYRNEILKEYTTFDNSILFKISDGKVNVYRRQAEGD